MLGENYGKRLVYILSAYEKVIHILPTRMEELLERLRKPTWLFKQNTSFNCFLDDDQPMGFF